MKAIEAPKKIYIPTVLVANTVRYKEEGSIEYVLSDAFIEKVCEFFSEHLWEYIDVKNANCNTFINIDGDKLKEDFRNYLKGE